MIPHGLLVHIRSMCLIWCLCDSIMFRKAAGKRTFSFSDLGHEKATTTILLFELSHLLSGLALHHISVLFFLLISYFFPSSFPHPTLLS